MGLIVDPLKFEMALFISVDNVLHGYANSTGFIYSNCHNTAANELINNNESIQAIPINE